MRPGASGPAHDRCHRAPWIRGRSVGPRRRSPASDPRPTHRPPAPASPHDAARAAGPGPARRPRPLPRPAPAAMRSVAGPAPPAGWPPQNRAAARPAPPDPRRDLVVPGRVLGRLLRVVARRRCGGGGGLRGGFSPWVRSCPRSPARPGLSDRSAERVGLGSSGAPPSAPRSAPRCAWGWAPGSRSRPRNGSGWAASRSEYGQSGPGTVTALPSATGYEREHDHRTGERTSHYPDDAGRDHRLTSASRYAILDRAHPSAARPPPHHLGVTRSGP